MPAIFSTIISAVLNWGLRLLTGWISIHNARVQGATDQAAKETATSAATSARVAQAEADAPKTAAELNKRFDDGTF